VNVLDDLKRKLDKILKDPNNPQLFNEVGVLLYRVNDLKYAERYLRRAYELNPSLADILYNYATLLYSQMKWKEAIPIYQDLFVIESNNKEVIEKVGDSYYQLGSYELASNTYEPLQKVQQGEF